MVFAALSNFINNSLFQDFSETCMIPEKICLSNNVKIAIKFDNTTHLRKLTSLSFLRSRKVVLRNRQFSSGNNNVFMQCIVYDDVHILIYL